MGKWNLNDEWIYDFSRIFAERMKPMDTVGILQEMLRQGLANDSRIRDYLLIRDYSNFLVRNSGCVMNTVYQLSDKYQLSERQVQNVIYEWRRRAGAKKRIVTLSKEVF